jgi:hypothetical protein
MNMEERLQVLKMVEAGQISAEEAAKLLTALESPQEPAEVKSTQKRWLRVRVTDQRTGKRRVNINVPLGLVDLATRMGVRFGAQKAPELGEIDLNEIMAAIKSGAEGKIVDVEDEEKGEHMEVYVE